MLCRPTKRLRTHSWPKRARRRAPRRPSSRPSNLHRHPAARRLSEPFHSILRQQLSAKAAATIDARFHFVWRAPAPPPKE